MFLSRFSYDGRFPIIMKDDQTFETVIPTKKYFKSFEDMLPHLTFNGKIVKKDSNGDLFILNRNGKILVIDILKRIKEETEQKIKQSIEDENQSRQLGVMTLQESIESVCLENNILKRKLKILQMDVQRQRNVLRKQLRYSKITLYSFVILGAISYWIL